MRRPRNLGTVYLQQLLDAEGRLGGCVVHWQPLLPPGPTHDDVVHDASPEIIELFLRVKEPISRTVLIQPLDDEYLSLGSKANLFRFRHHDDV